MKTTFYAYLRPTDQEFSDLWDNCIFSFDANILRNLYRYQEDTKDKFFAIFQNDLFKGRLFLTHRACLEFIRDRAGELSTHVKSYEKLLSDINTLVMGPLNQKNHHPYLSEELFKELSDVVGKVETEIKTVVDQIKAKYSNDPILDNLISVFDQKVSNKMSNEELGKIYVEGESRYKDRIPPGFKDSQKHGNEKYGDLVIWKQIIAHINESNLKNDVIFVTDDGKEDWWLEHRGIRNPHPMLIEEFYEETKQKIYFYTSEMFLKYASERINAAVSQDVIDEVVEVRENTSTSSQEPHLDSPNANYKVITEEELMNQMHFFIQNVKTGGYIGLRRFVTEFLASQDYEINHSYAIINNLVEKKLITINAKFIDALGYYVQVVEIIEPTRPTYPS